MAFVQRLFRSAVPARQVYAPLTLTAPLTRTPLSLHLPAYSAPFSLQLRHNSTSHPALPFKIPDIPFNTVQVRDEETRRLGPPQSLKSVYESLDPEVYYVHLVSKSPAVVRIRSIAEAVAEHKEQQTSEQTRKHFKSSDKEIQISWSTADGDLALKLRKARQIIEKGDNVNIVFAPRAGKAKTPITKERIRQILDTFDNSLPDIADKKKPDDVKQRVIYQFWEPKQDIKLQAAKITAQHISEDKAQREAKKERRRQKGIEGRLAAEAKKKAFFEEQERKQQELMRQVQEQRARR